LGANIMVDTDRTIRIQQATQFHDVEHTVLTDRNEVASYAVAAVSTKGRVFIEGAEHVHMIAFLNKLREVGGGFQVKAGGIEFFYEQELKGGIHLETDVHPGFMTDWQQPFVVLLTQAHGASVVHETVYENRFGYTHALKQMGADIQLFNQCLGGRGCRFTGHNHHHSLVVKGPTALKGREFAIPDLRAGFAYAMAALLSTDESTISNVDYLDRGYEDLVNKLSSLGADITRVPTKKRVDSPAVVV